MSTVHLDERSILSISGADAEHFLQNLITPDLGQLQPGEAKPGALLTPQGKILFDFLVARTGDGFTLECRRDIAAELAKRLTMYKLRAKVTIAESDQHVVAVSWDAESGSLHIDSTALIDRRFSSPVTRHHSALPDADVDMAAWTAFRIANGVAESGSDYELGDAFPHDVLYDQNGGVGLKKGCFVGQEVVSRMQHRGTARRRVMIVRAEKTPGEAGNNVLVAGRPIGTLGSVAGDAALAIVRIDKVADARASDTPITANGVKLDLTIPDWASYTLPETAGAQGED